MTTAEFLESLLTIDVTVRLEADKVRVSAPRGRLTPELQRVLAERKEEIRRYLSAQASPAAARETRPQSSQMEAPIHPGAATGDTAARPVIEGDFPLSFGQRRFWFLDRLNPGNCAYNIGAAYYVSDIVDADALEQGINDVVQRQGVLRTVFPEINGAPVQRVLPFRPLALECIDITDLPPEERPEEVKRQQRAEAALSFDLGTGPLLRVKLLKASERQYVLLFTMHHIVSDNWSLGIFLQELKQHYSARRAGHAASPAPLTTQYAEHSARERALLEGPNARRLLDYWLGTLKGAPPAIELPTDRPRPPQQTYNGRALDFALPTELSSSLRALAKRERATLYMTLLAIFSTLLHRYSGQSDMVIGTPIANRESPELEHLIGLFVSTLPLRVRVEGEISASALIAQVRDTVLDAASGQDLPFEKLVEALRPERSLSRSPIFQIVFALQSTPLSSAFEVTTVASMFDLSLFMWDSADAIRGVLEYNTDLFDAGTLECFRDHFIALCTAVVADPDCPVSRLPMLTEGERDLVLRGWNATQTDYPRDSSIPAVFGQVAAAYPDAVAVEAVDPKTESFPAPRLTYRELDRASSALAAHLRNVGVEPGATVAIVLDRSIAAIVSILATLKAGATYVPLAADAPKARTAEMLQTAGARIAVTSAAHARKLSGLSVQIVSLEAQWAEIVRDEREFVAAAVAPDALAYLMFTSGTTGKPKGVCVTHRNVLRLACSANYVDLGPEEAVLQFAPLPFDASTLEIWGALLNGARLVVFPGRVPAAKELGQTLEVHRITTLWLTAGFFHYMIEQELSSLSAVRQILAGGDVLSVPRVQQLLDAKSDGVVVNGYGPTENTTFTCCHVMSPGVQLSGTVPIGRPIANTRVYILDSGGNPVPAGVAGELYAGGDGVARGYLGEASLSEGKFLSDPFSDRAGAMMYRTGDSARWRADGAIEFLGRQDRQVKVRGFRIELEEIENALREGLHLRDATVVAQRDATGVHTLAAYLVADETGELTTEEIRRLLGERLPDYMLPSVFMYLPGLPLTPNGKLDRAALPEPAPVQRAAIVEPRSTVETQLLAIWKRIILERADFGVRDNFFELGGHSLLAVRMFALVEKVFGRRLPASALFQAPTIEQLALRLEREGFHSPWDSLVAIQPDGSRPPLFLVPGIGGNVVGYVDLAEQLGADRPVYGLQSRGLDGRDQPFERVPPMAEHYVGEIRKLQPHGPYYIGGACFGGAVAWEMAQQLRSAGEEVAFLLLLETWPPPKQRRARFVLSRYGQYARFIASGIRRNMLALARAPRGQILRMLRHQSRIVGEMMSSRDVYRGDLAAFYIDRVSTSNYNAFAHYQPKAYDGSVMLVLASKREVGTAGEDPRLVWGRLAERGCIARRIPARDSGLALKRPHVEILAEWMREAMETAARRAPAGAAAPAGSRGETEVTGQEELDVHAESEAADGGGPVRLGQNAER